MFQPLNDQIIVERDEAVTHEGTIELAQPKIPCTGTVKAVGPGAIHPALNERMTMQVKPGDRIVWLPYSGDEIQSPESTNKEDRLFVLREQDIAAIISPKE